MTENEYNLHQDSYQWTSMELTQWNGDVLLKGKLITDKNEAVCQWHRNSH